MARRLLPAPVMHKLTLLILLGTATSGRAEPEQRSWYGWQILATDAASWGTMFGGLGNSYLAPIGLGGLVLGAPVTHLAHGDYKHAAGSLGLRIGALGFGYLVGVAVAAGPCSGDRCDGPIPMLWAIGFGGLGMLGAEIVDIGWLSTKTEPAAAIAPTVSVTPSAMSFGVIGRF